MSNDHELQEVINRVEKIRDAWATIRDKNRQLGWPEMADVVGLPRAFVDDLDAALCFCCADGRYTTSDRWRVCRTCSHDVKQHNDP